MFVIEKDTVKTSGIDSRYLIPYVKSPAELQSIEFNNNYIHYLFACETPLAKLPAQTKAWVKRFENAKNTNGTQTIQQACSAHNPFWYSIQPKQANIVTAINPYERFFFSFSNTPFTIDQRLIAIRVNEPYQMELIAALLNSATTLLMLEMRGTSRNLGALDLNANYLKQLRILNPDLLTDKQKQDITTAFQPLKRRQIGSIFEEIERPDRINFDKTILCSFGIDDNLLDSIYTLLTTSVRERVSMRDK
jgi:hypothetical protein